MFDSNIVKVKEKIEKGEISIGTHVKIGEPIVTDILCNCGFDIIWVDGEHGLNDRKDINLQILIIRGAGLAPFVRIPWNDPILAKPVLEMGPAAIIFPFIKTVEEAKFAVASCKYPPRGIRGFGPMKANNYSTIDDNEYLKLAELEPWVILQIEHVDGINNLEDIIKVEGVDSVVIGPNDLSGSVGLLGQTRHPHVINLMENFAQVCKGNNFPFGVSIGWDKKNVEEWLNRGASWICIESDVSYLVNGGRNVFNKVVRMINPKP